jgi:hypothetical protein
MRIEFGDDYPPDDSGDSSADSGLRGKDLYWSEIWGARSSLEGDTQGNISDLNNSSGMIPAANVVWDPHALAASPADLSTPELVDNIVERGSELEEDEEALPVLIPTSNASLSAVSDLLQMETGRRGGIDAAGDVTIVADHGVVAGTIGQVNVQVARKLGKPVRLPPRPPVLAGREGLLADLGSLLVSDPERTSPRIVVLHGLGGIGKTSAAVEYAYRHVDNFDAVWYFPTEDPLSVAAGFADLASMLGAWVHTSSGNPIAAVHSALAVRPGRWLLIFDNASGPQDLAALVPPLGHGSVIVTSQNPSWPGLHRIEVQGISLEEAANFLLAGRKKTVPLDRVFALDLAEKLGCLPLALAQADAYMETAGCAIDEYRSLYEKRRAEMHDRGDAPGYDKRVATTWSLAFDFIKRTVGAPILLRLLSCFAPDDIPVRLLLRPNAGVLDRLPTAASLGLKLLIRDRLIADAALATLRRFSLISAPEPGDPVSMHRLVQAVTLDNLESQEPGQLVIWRTAAFVLADAALTEDPRDKHSWEAYEALVHHIASVFPTGSAATGRVAAYLGYSGRPSAARDLMRQVVSARQSDLGADHPDTLGARGQLAYWTGRAGDAATAQDQFAELIPELNRVLGPDHPDTLHGRTNLARWAGRAGDASAARDELAELVPDLIRMLGAGHPDTLSARDCLARRTGEAGNPAKAADLYAVLVEDLEQTRGKDHYETRLARRKLARWSRTAP